MSIRNRVSLIGYVGNAPEHKTLDNGGEITKFSLGTHEHYKNEKGEKVTTTDWHYLVSFGKLASIISQYVKKGAMIAVEGRLKSRSYEKSDGSKAYVTEIIIESFEFLENKS